MRARPVAGFFGGSRGCWLTQLAECVRQALVDKYGSLAEAGVAVLKQGLQHGPLAHDHEWHSSMSKTSHSLQAAHLIAGNGGSALKGGLKLNLSQLVSTDQVQRRRALC